MQIPAARGALLISLQHMFRLFVLFQPLLLQSDCMLLSFEFLLLDCQRITSPIMPKSLFDSAMEREFMELYVVIFAGRSAGKTLLRTRSIL